MKNLNNFLNSKFRMLKFLVFESAYNYLNFAGSKKLNFALVFVYESFQFLLLVNIEIYRTKVDGKIK